MPLPGLHVVTDDAVLATADFLEGAAALMETHGPAVALHLRGPRTPVARLLSLAERLAATAADSGTPLLLNDRADVALAVNADGVQLGRRSLPVAAARGMAPHWVIGASVHGVDEASRAEAADFLVVGSIWETASHPGRRGAGLALIGEIRDRLRTPVVAIGGVTRQRAAAARRAGAYGVAVIRGVWESGDPVLAATGYLDALGEGTEGRA